MNKGKKPREPWEIVKNMTDPWSSVIICLGANLPLRTDSADDTLRKAIARLAQEGVSVDAVSRFFLTPCFPAGAGPDYVNAAITATSRMSPDILLQLLHEIETEFGRNRKTRWGQRTLDLDLIAFGDRILPDLEGYHAWESLPVDRQQLSAPDRLGLPHPRMQDRAFVLVPLMDIAPDWRHPVSGLTIRTMVAALPEADIDAVRPL